MPKTNKHLFVIRIKIFLVINTCNGLFGAKLFAYHCSGNVGCLSLCYSNKQVSLFDPGFFKQAN